MKYQNLSMQFVAIAIRKYLREYESILVIFIYLKFIDYLGWKWLWFRQFIIDFWCQI